MIRKALLLLLVIGAALAAVAAQRRGGPPRRIQDPQTIHLQAGGRVEFRTFEAPSIGGESRYSILIPASYDKESERRFPVVYFLHGLNNDHTSWAVERYGNIPQKIETLMESGTIPEALFVHPDNGRGLYTNTLDDSVRYEDIVTVDLVERIDTSFRTIANRSGRALGGVSMGAYGSIKIGLKHPEEFSAVAGISPIILLGDDPSAQMSASQSRMAQFFAQLFQPVFGIPFDLQHWKANSIEALAREVEINGLPIYFSYGTADRYNQAFPMQKGVETLEAILTERHIAHTYKSYDGEPHGWELVNNHLEEVIGFLTAGF